MSSGQSGAVTMRLQGSKGMQVWFIPLVDKRVDDR